MFQLAIPPGGEATAREFWVDALGFTEIDKTPNSSSPVGEAAPTQEAPEGVSETKHALCHPPRARAQGNSMSRSVVCRPMSVVATP